MSKIWHVIAAEEQAALAQSLVAQDPAHFVFFPTSWGKFPDGTDHIVVGGFDGGKNLLAGKHVLFLASFHNNDVTLSQFYVMVMLCESFVESLTVVLPFYPTGTMERVVREGEVATASTMARLFSSLPSPGKPVRVMIYDIHTLQNRFYIANHAVASLRTTIPLLLAEIRKGEVDAIAFPDEGASKRFSHLFKEAFPDLHVIICGKVRDGDKRIVHIEEGQPDGRNVVIIDDLVQTGGTLYECALALQARGAASVSAFVAHAVFPNSSFSRFARGGDRCAFRRFWVTNSNPFVTSRLPKDDVFQVLDLAPQLLLDLADC